MAKVIQIEIPRIKKDIKIYYEIVVITNIEHYKKCYSKVYKRYSDFLKLYYKTKSHIKFKNFPPKKFWITKHDIEERRLLFIKFLRSVVEFIEVNGSYKEKWAKEAIQFLQNDVE
ncbi:HCLS1-binding protein 3 [Dictyocoela muelleri]|nr:HCLS1-binding protein 3 [Dictyocoela muelleri]